ncbi:hypothetical protein [Thermotalea metallivorans]|uniref:Uncharacterized protein n=1 Tax=Thermotalea metallivorans TaxID=520762 RepID=A0A140L9Y9_9FIRM|nr:hypothetical protein [Thermotalea metallivorans]KXG77364.1 hypothetical protein AN619_04900 [Thermotalea metallivorans]
MFIPKGASVIIEDEYGRGSEYECEKDINLWANDCIDYQSGVGHIVSIQKMNESNFKIYVKHFSCKFFKKRRKSTH